MTPRRQSHSFVVIENAALRIRVTSLAVALELGSLAGERRWRDAILLLVLLHPPRQLGDSRWHGRGSETAKHPAASLGAVRGVGGEVAGDALCGGGVEFRIVPK